MATKINKDDLEKALSNTKVPKTAPAQEAPKMSKEQEIAFHQGALTTLNNERAELFKMIQNVEAVMQAHLKRLEEMGVKIQTKK
jgi:argininosuccinate synthase